jgi:phage terminase small subunit
MTQNRPLTQKQENFCQNILKGMSQYQAYLQAYEVQPTTGREVVDISASRLIDEPKIALRIKELRDKVENQNVLSIQKKREILHEIASNKDEKASDRISSIDTDNKMLHVYNQPTESHITIELIYDSSRLLQHDKEPDHVINGEVKELPEKADITEENKADLP